ncbi:hypothetical protein C8R47DRAFT_1312532 [Mycena vitilis]|nr:hypothetical protein C8R47DRAFT_1312532 [Mycena vitilis]
MSPVMSSTFFPITDGNRHQPLSVSAALGAFPFRVHTSAILQEMMIASGDSCENLRITKVEYFQRDVAPLHEYLVFSFADCDTRGVASFMILERWGTDFQPPDKTKSKATEHPITLDATGISESTTTKTLSDHSRNIAVGSARLSMELSGTRIQSAANDRVLIAVRRDPFDVSKAEPGTSTCLATIVAPHTSTVSVAQIMSLASFVSQHSPVYDLLESNCFYYGRAIFDVTRRIMHCNSDDIATAPDFVFMKADALQCQPAQTIKTLMANKVRAEFRAAGVKERYEKGFSEFLGFVQAQKERNDHPLMEARAETSEARNRMEEAEAETSKARNRMEEAEAEASKARNRMEEAEAEAIKARNRQEEAEAEIRQLRALLQS